MRVAIQIWEILKVLSTAGVWQLLKSLSEITLGAQQFYPRNAQCAALGAWSCAKMLAKSFWPTQMRKIFENSKVTLR